MTNGAKILITIAVIITLVIVINGRIKDNKENVNENQTSNSDMMRYFDDYENIDIEKENLNKIEENSNEINTIVNNNMNNIISNK